MDTSDWSPYVAATTDRGPSPRLLDAIDRFDKPGRAADLGFGAGNETEHLLRLGWTVHAVDTEPAAHDALHTRVSDEDKTRLSTERTTLSRANLPTVDLVYAGSSLFFVPDDEQERLWTSIRAALVPGGWLVANLLGENDGWATTGAVVVHTLDRIAADLNGFLIAELRENEMDGTALAGPKHWHTWEIAARKR